MQGGIPRNTAAIVARCRGLLSTQSIKMTNDIHNFLSAEQAKQVELEHEAIPAMCPRRLEGCLADFVL